MSFGDEALGYGSGRHLFRCEKLLQWEFLVYNFGPAISSLPSDATVFLKSTGRHIQLHQERAEYRFLARIVRRGGLWGRVRDCREFSGEEGSRARRLSRLEKGRRVFHIARSRIFFISETLTLPHVRTLDGQGGGKEPITTSS